MLKKTLVLMLISCATLAQIKIKIDPTADKKPISPYLYGRNNSFASTNPNAVISAEDVVRIKDAGVTFFRESTGNNCTKYNWRKRLSSHPDWYNNVYTNDWDKVAQNLQKNAPNAQGMWAFQLIGKVAKTAKYNFNEWDYNRSQWWQGVEQNLAGNGVLNPTGTKAKVEGDPNLYLEDWPADSTVAMLDHWFSKTGLNLNKDKIQYWNLDNEPEIWAGTHDDLMPVQLPANDFMKRYFEVAKKARAKYPAIKLVGPVTANEWQWYNWNNGAISYEGKNYPWLEFFIKRIADEQQKTGIRLLDVLDIHFYPSTKKTEEIVQLHRVFFDRNFVFPEANGVKRVNGSWDNNQNKEYIFGRINDWLAQYLGPNHGVTLGLTEMGVESPDANTMAVCYASMMGEFMKNQVEIFAPWSWKVGMWEVLHLFSKNNKIFSIQATSADENTVSAYPSINARQDSMTVMLVNKTTTAQNIITNSDNFVLNNNAKVLTIKSLTNNETFVSKDQNALIKSDLAILNNQIQLSLPPLSVTAVLVTGKMGTFAPVILGNEPGIDEVLNLYPNPVSGQLLNLELGNSSFDKLEIIDATGKTRFTKKAIDHRQTLDIPYLESGIYLLKLTSKEGKKVKKIIVP